MRDELLIDRLLQVHYPQEYDLDTHGVVVDMTIHRGLVELSDSKACDDCQGHRPRRAQCDRVNLRLDTSASPVAIVDFEKYVNPNDGKYPLGKRAKASAQMKKSLERLLLDPLMAHYILTFPEKICLFGWRDYYAPDVTPLRGDAARNMLAFMRTPSANSGTLAKEISIIGHNFRFVQVKYPSEYKW